MLSELDKELLKTQRQHEREMNRGRYIRRQRPKTTNAKDKAPVAVKGVL